MTPRLFLHIGLQKTGTSYLQTICWASVDALREQGVELVPARKIETWWLALAVRERYNPEADPPEVATALDRFGESLRASTAPRALVSQEALASATEAQIERLLGSCVSHEVHVVITVRDLGRQLPSSWQEGLKAGGDGGLDEFVSKLRTAPTGRRGWRNLDPSAVAARWAKLVPSDRIHIVTVPPASAPPETLLERFCSVIGVDPSRLDTDQAGRGNPGLRRPQAELLRQVNKRLPEELRGRIPYGDVGKRYFAMQILAGKPGDRIQLSAAHLDWCTTMSRGFVESLGSGGYDIVGDLDDIVSPAEIFSSGEAEVPDGELLDVATQALADVLEDRLRQRRDARHSRAASTNVVKRATRWIRRHETKN